MKRMSHYLAIVCVLFSTSLLHAQDSDQVDVELARDGRALRSVIVGPEATPKTTELAATIADYLQKITDAKYDVEQGDGKTGIALGTPADFPSVLLSQLWPDFKNANRESYLIHSHAEGVYVIGASELAVEHAAWDLLYHFGYRQYFPGENWEIIPHRRSLSIAISALESPDYISRRIWYGFGLWDVARQPYDRWCQRNRVVQGTRLSTGHSYGRIIRANQTDFDAHPEYFALINGTRNVQAQGKFCVSNPGLRRLVAEDSVRLFDREPDADSISMEPSDGGGWCECDQCVKLGSVSDRALTLANEVAEAVKKKHGDKLVSMYAYNYHSPPPSIRAHQNVVISVATAFIKDGLTQDEILDGWARQGATLGIREYYSVNTWDRDLPAAARGSNIEYLRQTIPEFRRRGARFLSAESSDNWGPNGLGYFLAARMMWDIGEASQVDQLVEDFLSQCFGAAKEPMRTFYQELNGGRPHLVPSDQLGRMFTALRDARKMADAPAIDARLNDLILYSRYVDLYHRYSKAKSGQRQEAFETLIRHSYRMRKTMMIHSKAIYRDVVVRDKSVSIPENATWRIPDSKNPWKSSEPFSDAELTGFVDEGIRTNPLIELDFEPVSFGDDLVPAGPLGLESPPRTRSLLGRGTQTLYAQVDDLTTPIRLDITGGLIAHYRDRGNVVVQLWKIGGASEAGELKTLIVEDRSVPPDGKKHPVSLQATGTGLHKIVISDGGDLTGVAWDVDATICFKSSLDEPIKTSGRWNLYFYVPRKTKVIGLFGGGTPGTIRSPDGTTAFSFDGRPVGFYSIAVPKGNDGKLWKIHQAAGPIRLLTVPPYLARCADELLLPKEVVDADRKSE